MPLVEDNQRPGHPVGMCSDLSSAEKEAAFGTTGIMFPCGFPPTLFQASNLLIAAVDGWGKHISPKHNIS